ncbi:MAG: outer membrane beta-barrel protein [Candidatus Binatia bacterium]
MKMKSVSSLFCAVAIFGTASVAMAGAYGEPEQAEEIPRSAPPVAETVVEVDDFSPYPYIAAGGVYAKEFFEGDVHQVNTTYGWGWNARVGYRFHEMVAVELFAEHIVEFDSDAGGRNQSTDRKAWSLMPMVKFYPIQGFCEPYLSVGGGLIRGDHGNNWQLSRFNGSPTQFDPVGGKNSGNGVDQGYGFGMRFGIGADFYATEQVFIAPEVAYVLPLTSDVNNYDYMSVSLSVGYAFN